MGQKKLASLGSGLLSCAMLSSPVSPRRSWRRVCRYVCCFLLVALVAALWPLKGYRIKDDDVFVDSVASPYMRTLFVGAMDPLPEIARTKPVRFESVTLETEREAEDYLDPYVEWQEDDGTWDEAAVWIPERIPDRLVVLVRRGNLVCSVYVNAIEASLFPGMTRETLALECLATVREALGKEITGVTTFYNPPARQFWFDRARPFLKRYNLAVSAT